MASSSNLSTDITVLIQEYYEKMALKEQAYTNGLLKYAKKADIPKGQSKVGHFHRWEKLPLASDVGETSDPTGEAMNAVEVKVELTEFAGVVSVPNFGDAVRIDSVIKESYNKMTEQAERTANRRLLTALDGGSAGTSQSSDSFSAAKVIYANNRASFGSLTASDYLTNKDIQLAVGWLEQNQVPKINGSYVCLLNPWAKTDLLTYDQEFRDLLRGSADLKILKDNELPLWAGARIGLQDEPWREALGGTDGTYVRTGNVASCYVFGAESFGCSQLMGKTGVKPRFKVQDITTTGAVTTIGYRIPFGAAVLNSDWVVRLKHVVRDATVASVA